MDPQMERMMRMHNPDFKGMAKILEVNAKHPLIKAFNDKMESGDFDGSEHFASLIHDSALVSEGEPTLTRALFQNALSL